MAMPFVSAGQYPGQHATLSRDQAAREARRNSLLQAIALGIGSAGKLVDVGAGLYQLPSQIRRSDAESQLAVQQAEDMKEMSPLRKQILQGAAFDSMAGGTLEDRQKAMAAERALRLRGLTTEVEVGEGTKQPIIDTAKAGATTAEAEADVAPQKAKTEVELLAGEVASKQQETKQAELTFPEQLEMLKTRRRLGEELFDSTVSSAKSQAVADSVQSEFARPFAEQGLRAGNVDIKAAVEAMRQGAELQPFRVRGARAEAGMAESREARLPEQIAQGIEMTDLEMEAVIQKLLQDEQRFPVEMRSAGARADSDRTRADNLPGLIADQRFQSRLDREASQEALQQSQEQAPFRLSMLEAMDRAQRQKIEQDRFRFAPELQGLQTRAESEAYDLEEAKRTQGQRDAEAEARVRATNAQATSPEDRRRAEREDAIGSDRAMRMIDSVLKAGGDPQRLESEFVAGGDPRFTPEEVLLLARQSLRDQGGEYAALPAGKLDGLQAQDVAATVILDPSIPDDVKKQALLSLLKESGPGMFPKNNPLLSGILSYMSPMTLPYGGKMRGVDEVRLDLEEGEKILLDYLRQIPGYEPLYSDPRYAPNYPTTDTHSPPAAFDQERIRRLYDLFPEAAAASRQGVR